MGAGRGSEIPKQVLQITFQSDTRANQIKQVLVPDCGRERRIRGRDGLTATIARTRFTALAPVAPNLPFDQRWQEDLNEYNGDLCTR